jgi:hypothetical protein
MAQGQRVHPRILPVRVANEGDHPQHLLHPQRDPQRLVVSSSLHHQNFAHFFVNGLIEGRN